MQADSHDAGKCVGVRVRCCSVRWAVRGREGPCVSFNSRHCSSLPVAQLQMTLASVQELLIQQQQKVQELAHELVTAKVLVPDPRVPPGVPCTVSSFAPSSLCPVGSFVTLVI